MTVPSPRFRIGFVLLVLGVGAAALVLGLLLLRPAAAPSVTWRFGADRTAVQPFEQVPMWEPMDCEVDLPFPAFVYVVSFDYVRGTVTYFPTEYLGTDHLDQATGTMNRLAAGRHRIPGTWDAKPLTWYVPNTEESVSLCVVVSRQAIPELDARLVLTRQFGNRAFKDRSMGYYMPRAGRDQLIGQKALPHPVLQAAQSHSGLETSMVPWSGRDDVYVGGFTILPGKARAGATHPGNPFTRQLHDAVNKKQGAGGSDGPIKIDLQPGKPGK
jgi:hypothetical protein